MNLKVINGSLFQDGIKISPEFGNPDHIKAIEEASKVYTGLYLPHDEEERIFYEARIPCICGKKITIESEGDELSDYTLLVTEKKACWSCKQEYSVYVEDNTLMYKAIRKYGK